MLCRPVDADWFRGEEDRYHADEEPGFRDSCDLMFSKAFSVCHSFNYTQRD